MNVPIRLLPVLLFSLLFVLLIATAGLAQDTASATSTEGGSEAASQGESQEENESFWDKIASSIVDFFTDNSEEAVAAQDENLGADDDQGIELDGERAMVTPRERARKREIVGREPDSRPTHPHRRLTLPQTRVSAIEVTPSHVYQSTVDLISEIHVLRGAMNITDTPTETRLQQLQTPNHAYAKCMEIMRKTARVQRRLGMIPVDPIPAPVKEVAHKDVYQVIQTILEELRRIKRQIVVTEDIQPAPFIGGKIPALIHENLMQASLLLDDLVGRRITPNDVFLHVNRVHDEIRLIADRLGIDLETDPPDAGGQKIPMDVAQQIVRAAYKTILLQSKLGMEASSVPTYSLQQVTSADVYDATNFLLAETARIKAHLNVTLSSGELRGVRDKTTADSFAQILLIIRNLDTMNEAADGAG